MDYSKAYPFLINEESKKQYFHDESIYSYTMESILSAQIGEFNKMYQHIHNNNPGDKNPKATSVLFIITTYLTPSPNIGIQLHAIPLPPQISKKSTLFTGKKDDILISFIGAALSTLKKVFTGEVNSGELYNYLCSKNIIDNHKVVGFIYCEEVMTLKVDKEDYLSNNISQEDIKKRIDSMENVHNIFTYTLLSPIEQLARNFLVTRDESGAKIINTEGELEKPISNLVVTASDFYEEVMSSFHQNNVTCEKVLKEELFFNF